MNKVMILLLSAMILFFGCVTEEAAPAAPSGETPAEQPPSAPEEPTGAEEECDASYAFSQLASGRLSETATFVVTATCAKGKDVELYLNDKMAAHMVVPSNDPTVLNFDIVPKVDGESSVVVKSGGETVYSETWNVALLGSTDTAGDDYDQISNKNWLAVAFDIENPIQVGSLGAYMKRLESQTLQNSFVIASIHMDHGGNPSMAELAKSELSIDDTTMTDNWIYFNFDDIRLDSGRYWAVFRISKDEPTLVGDTATIHYVSQGSSQPTNDYTRTMTLEWSNDEREWVVTEWHELPFGKEYSVVLSSHSH